MTRRTIISALREGDLNDALLCFAGVIGLVVAAVFAALMT